MPRKKNPDYNSHQHSVYKLTYHAVFVVKYRREVITQGMLQDMRMLTARLMEGYGGKLTEMDGEADHVHVLFELPPSAAPSRIVCSLKTQLSKVIRAKYKDDLKEKLWGDAFWAGSYFLTTTGGASIEVVEKYIQNQGKPKRPYRKKNSPELGC